MLAISPQDVDSHQRWAEKEGFTFALLADTELRVIDTYGVKGGNRVPVQRAVFVVDTRGVVRYRLVGQVRAIFKRPRALAKILEGID